jgi:hypothetical protein
MMLSSGLSADGSNVVVKEVGIGLAKELSWNCHSAVGHESTAAILSALLGKKIEFNRVSLSLKNGDELLCIIPNFRADVAREFTHDEVFRAGFRCFFITVK